MKNIVIIPTLNERNNIERLIKRILEISDISKIIVVDDSSLDGTKEILENISQQYSRVEVIYRNGVSGLGRSYIEGFKYLLSGCDNFENIITMDADFSHDPQYIQNLLEETEYYDVIVGSRYINGISVLNWPLGRLLLSIFANWFVRNTLAFPIRDVTSGFVCYKKKALYSLDLDEVKSDGYAFQIEMKYKLHKKRFSFKEIPIIFVDRRHDKSKLNGKDILKTALSILKLIISG